MTFIVKSKACSTLNFPTIKSPEGCYLTGCTMRLLCHDVIMDVSLWRQGCSLTWHGLSLSLSICVLTYSLVSHIFWFHLYIRPSLFPYSVSKMWHYGSVAVCGAAYVERVWKSWGLGALQPLFSNCHDSRQIRLAILYPQPVWATPDSPRHCHSTPIFAV